MEKIVLPLPFIQAKNSQSCSVQAGHLHFQTWIPLVVFVLLVCTHHILQWKQQKNPARNQEYLMSITLALPHFNNKSYMLTESGCQNKFEVPLPQLMLLDSNIKTESRMNNNSLISIPIRYFYPYFSFFFGVCVCAIVIWDWKLCSYMGCTKYPTLSSHQPSGTPPKWSKPYLLKPESRVRLIKWHLVGEPIRLYATIPSTYINRTQLMIVWNCMLL